MTEGAPVTVLVLAERSDPQVADLRADGVRFVVGTREEELGDAVREAAAMFFKVDGALVERLLPRAERLRWIHSNWTGIDALLRPAIVGSGLTVTNTRGVYSPALAEFALLSLLYFAKDVPRMLRAQRDGRWDPFLVGMLRGATVGLLGYGSIARALAPHLVALGARVVAHRRTGADVDPPVTRAASLDALLEVSDYVVLALPGTADTTHILGPRELARMRPDAVIVNVGRGSAIDEAALVRALDSGVLRGAALDVFETEPLPAGHALYRLPQVLLSPHCADRTATWQVEARAFFEQNLARFLRGAPLENVVDLSRGY